MLDVVTKWVNRIANLDKELNRSKQKGGVVNDFIKIRESELKLDNYMIQNNRELCSNNRSKDECVINPHCDWLGKKCIYTISEEKLIEFISRVVDELINNELKSKEILNVEQYFVSDIVNYNNYTYREKQKIIKSDNLNINKIMTEIFGKSNIPIIGRRKIIKSSKIINDENLLNSIEKIGDIYYQKIINSNVIFRAYANSLYWIKNKMSDIMFRNLGYYSMLQTDLANIFKSYIYDWIVNVNNQELLYGVFKDIVKMEKNVFIDDYRTKLFLQKEYYYLGLVDLYILNQYHHIPIVLIDQYDNIFCVIDEKIQYKIDKDENNKIFDEILKKKDEKIKIKYNSVKISFNTIPSNLISIYEI